MIQQQTKLKVSDNSGAKTVKCIKVLGGFKKRYAYTGDKIIVSVTELRNKSKKTSKVKKGEIFKALIIKSKTRHTQKDGSVMFFEDNSVTLINKQNQPLASRILTPISKKLKKNQFSKFLNISLGTI